MTSPTRTARAEAARIDGVTGGTGGVTSLIKTGDGTLILAGTNTYTGGTAIDGGTLRAGAANAFGSGPITVGSQTTLDLNGFDQTINLLAGDGRVDLGSATLTTGGNNADATFSLSFFGPGSLTKVGAGTLTLAGVNSCDLTIEAGRLEAGVQDAFGGGGLTVNGGTVSLAGFGTGLLSLAGSGGVLEMAGGQLLIAQATSTTFNGEITGGGGNSALTIHNTDSGTLTLGGPITGSFLGLTLAGGTLVLGGANTYTGHTAVIAGLLQVDGSITQTINVDGGTLGGSGTVGDVLVADDGALAPGASTGILHTGNLSLAAGADFFVELAGTAAGTGYDQAAVTGTVDISGASLAVSTISGFHPNIGEIFTIIANDGADSITGQFAGLAQGATFVAAGSKFQINYSGGDGNDVALVAVGNAAPAVTAFDQSAVRGQVFNASDLFSASDGDGDSLLYFFYDNSADPASGHFTVNGVVQAANTTFAVSAAQLAQTTFTAGQLPDDLFVNTWDCSLFSGPQEFHVNVPANQAPTVTAADFSASKGQVVNASDLFTANDANGDPLLYFFYDNSADPDERALHRQRRGAGCRHDLRGLGRATRDDHLHGRHSGLGRSVRECLGWRRLQRAEGVPRQRGEQRADGHGA